MTLVAFRQIATPLRRVFRPRPRTFPSFEAAAEACISTYQDEMLNRFRMERAKLNLPHLGEDDLTSSYWALKLSVSSLERPTLSIVDYGGSCGEYGYVLQRKTGASLFYTVVENPVLAALCADQADFGHARFTSQLPRASDIFFSSGALQYVADPMRVLEQAFLTTRLCVILGRNSFTRGMRIYSVQTSRLADNGCGRILPQGYDLDRPIQYPHGTIDLDELLCLARRLGWERAAIFPNSSGVHGGEEVCGMDLVFHRVAALYRC